MLGCQNEHTKKCHYDSLCSYENCPFFNWKYLVNAVDSTSSLIIRLLSDVNISQVLGIYFLKNLNLIEVFYFSYDEVFLLHSVEMNAHFIRKKYKKVLAQIRPWGVSFLGPQKRRGIVKKERMTFLFLVYST